MKIFKYLLNFLFIYIVFFTYNKLTGDYSTKILNILEIIVLIVNIYILFYIKSKIIKIVLFILFIMEFILQVSPSINDMLLVSDNILYLVGSIRILSIFTAFYLMFDEKILGIMILIKTIFYYIELLYDYNFLLTAFIIIFIVLRDLYKQIKDYKKNIIVNNEINKKNEEIDI